MERNENNRPQAPKSARLAFGILMIFVYLGVGLLFIFNFFGITPGDQLCDRRSPVRIRSVARSQTLQRMGLNT